MADDSKNPGNTPTDPEVTKADPPLRTIADESGFDKRAAAESIAQMNEAFRLQQEQIRKLSATVMEQQKTIQQLGGAGAGGKRLGTVAVTERHCNVDGTRVEEGKRCPRGKHHKINEIGLGFKHNRMQPIIVRQV